MDCHISVRNKWDIFIVELLCCKAIWVFLLSLLNKRTRPWHWKFVTVIFYLQLSRLPSWWSEENVYYLCIHIVHPSGRRAWMSFVTLANQTEGKIWGEKMIMSCKDGEKVEAGIWRFFFLNFGKLHWYICTV